MSNPNKFATERNQRAVLELVSKPGNGAVAMNAWRRICGLMNGEQISAQTARRGTLDGHRITLGYSSGAYEASLNEFGIQICRKQRELREHTPQDRDPYLQSVRIG